MYLLGYELYSTIKNKKIIYKSCKNKKRKIDKIQQKGDNKAKVFCVYMRKL